MVCDKGGFAARRSSDERRETCLCSSDTDSFSCPAFKFARNEQTTASPRRHSRRRSPSVWSGVQNAYGFIIHARRWLIIEIRAPWRRALAPTVVMPAPPIKRQLITRNPASFHATETLSDISWGCLSCRWLRCPTSPARSDNARAGNRKYGARPLLHIHYALIVIPALTHVRPEPPGDLLVNVSAREQVEMSRLASNPLPADGEMQISRSILVSAEGACNRHEAVADQAILKAAGSFRSRGGDRVAGDALGQGNGAALIGLASEAVVALPVLVQEVSVAQVGDAGAPDLAQPPEGGDVGRLAENDVNPIADPLERRAVMRRPEKDEPVQLLPPDTTCLFRVSAGAARDEPAHAVADGHEFFDFDRPFGDEHLERVRESAAVGRDV